MIKMFYISLLLTTTFSVQAQLGTQLNTEEAMEAFTLYSDQNQTYLIDNCGGVINTWPYGRFNFHLHPKLLDNGNIMFIHERNNNKFSIEEYNWDGIQEVSIQETVPGIILHYEVIKLENGNYLTVGREQLSFQEFESLGYNTDSTFPMYMDMVLELNPQGDIVWQWNIKDHMIQERNPNIPNYGIVADHPELLDMDVPLKSVDWNFTETFMINSFDYNPTLDQIIISVRKMGEIVIIDHGTTTTEAAGHTGGRYGKGGDVLWRWGNPQNYGVGTADDRFLYYQHNPNWIDQGEYKGMITCFDNGLDRPNTSIQERYSQVPIVDTKVKADGSYEMENGIYSPEGLQKVYGKITTNTQFFSDYTSGAEILPNGNIHITIGRDGRMIEINPEGEEVWRFNIENSSYIYRSEKYPTDHPAFQGRDMTPQFQIFTDYDCELYTATIDLDEGVSVDYNIERDQITLSSNSQNLRYLVSNIYGITLNGGDITTHSTAINTTGYPRGIYFLTFSSKSHIENTVKFVR